MTSRALMRPGLVWALCSAVASDCAPNVAPSAQPTSPPSRAAVAAQSPPASATAAASAAPAAAPDPLVRIGEFNCVEAHLQPLNGKAFLTCGQELLVLDGDTLRRDAALEPGLPRDEVSSMWRLEALGGAWPESTWLAGNRPINYGMGLQAGFFRWSGGRWVKVGESRPEYGAVALIPWEEGGVLALTQQTHQLGALLVPLGKHSSPAPRFTEPRLPHPHCAVRIRVEAYAVIAPGDLIVAGGQTCDTERTPHGPEPIPSLIAVERFRRGSPRGQFTPLPLPEAAEPPIIYQASEVVALSQGELYVAGRILKDGGASTPYLWRFDGSTWELVPPWLERGVKRAWLGHGDELWATDFGEGLWRRRGGRWSLVWQPGEREQVTQVWSPRPGESWVLTDVSLESTRVYRGRARP